MDVLSSHKIKCTIKKEPSVSLYKRNFILTRLVQKHGGFCPDEKGLKTQLGHCSWPIRVNKPCLWRIVLVTLDISLQGDTAKLAGGTITT